MSPRLFPLTGRPMDEKRQCCRCGFENAFLKTFYLEGVGHFVPGAEPWSCRECLDYITTLNHVDRQAFFTLKKIVFLTTTYQYIGALGAAFMSGKVEQ